MWLHSNSLGSGNRWYKVRVRPQYGLMRDVGVPCVVNPRDPGELWIDWDAAYDEHLVAWEREARVRREVSRRRGGLDGALERIGNPFAGKLRPGEEAYVERAIDREAERTRELQERAAEYNAQRLLKKGLKPAVVTDGESAELRRRMDELVRIHNEGIKTTGTIVAREDTTRTFANIPVILLTFEIDGRHVVFEHVYGPRHAKRYKPGARFDVWVDRDDPDAICPGR